MDRFDRCNSPIARKHKKSQFKNMQCSKLQFKYQKIVGKLLKALDDLEGKASTCMQLIEIYMSKLQYRWRYCLWNQQRAYYLYNSYLHPLHAKCRCINAGISIAYNYTYGVQCKR